MARGGAFFCGSIRDDASAIGVVDAIARGTTDVFPRIRVVHPALNAVLVMARTVVVIVARCLVVAARADLRGIARLRKTQLVTAADEGAIGVLLARVAVHGV